MSSVNLQITKAENETLPLDRQTNRQTDVKDCWHYRSAKIQDLRLFPRNWFIWRKKKKTDQAGTD